MDLNKTISIYVKEGFLRAVCLQNFAKGFFFHAISSYLFFFLIWWISIVSQGETLTEFSKEFLEELTNILQANIVYMDIYHTWNLDNCNMQFKEEILNFTNNYYKMLYFREDKDDGNDIISKYGQGIDYLNKALYF